MLSADFFPTALTHSHPPLPNASKKLPLYDEYGNALMTLPYLIQICVQAKGYRTPELNEQIYAHYKGSQS